MTDFGWHKPEVNRQNVWQAYVDQFGGGHAFGLLQEDGQNSFDAYSEGTKPKEMKVVIRYDADKRILRWQDFNTRGMFHCRDCTWGLRPGDIPCTNTDCPWGAFHNMGYSAKGGLSVGSRGMGKALQLLAGDHTIVRTTLPDGSHAASEWVKKGDWQWRLSPEHAKQLSSPGTEIVTEGVTKVVHDALLDIDGVVAELQARWFRLLEEGATLEYLLIKNGSQKRRVIATPPMPELDISQGPKRATIEMSKVIITYQGERLGELRNLHLYIAKEPFGEDNKRAGIAIVKNGKQTITRFTDFSSEIPENIRHRIFGWCDAICTPDEPFLKEAENSTHTDYRSDSVVYKAVKRQLREIVKTFTQPFTRAGGERVNEREAQEARELLSVLNQALADIPELSLFGRGPPEKKEPPKKAEWIYLSAVNVENKNYPRGSLVDVTAVVKNPTPKEQMVRVVFEHYDPTPVVVASSEEPLILPPGTPEAPSTKEVEWRCALDPSLAPGIHWVQVALRNVEKHPLTDDKGKRIQRRHWLYVEVDPPEIKRRGTESRGDEDEGERPGLNNLQWFKKPELADTWEAFIDLSQGAAFVNLRGTRLDHFRRTGKHKKAFWPVVGELVGEKLVEHLLDQRLSEKDDWKAEEVKTLAVGLANKRAELVRRMVQLVGAPEPKDGEIQG